MPKTKPRLSRRKSSRSRTNRARNIKESWLKRKQTGVDNDISTSNRIQQLVQLQNTTDQEYYHLQTASASSTVNVNISDLNDNFGIGNDSETDNPVQLQNLELVDLEKLWNSDTSEVEEHSQNASTSFSSNINMDNTWGTDKEFNEIMSEQLSIEVVPKEDPKITGNRIVEIAFLLERTISIAEDHARTCTSGRLRIDKEVRNGLTSTISYKCSMCNKTFSCATENTTTPTINKGTVWGTFATGSTFKHTEEFLSVLNIPSLSNTMFYSIQDDLTKIWMDSAWSDMEKAGKEEYAIAKEKGNIDKDGTPWVCVYLDGGWSKRSYGHNYNAASGVGVIIGRETKKVLYLGVRNKFCVVCTRAANKNTSPAPHVCFKNWTGSSAAMESDIIVEGFCRSEDLHGLRYKKFIADGDSSVYIKIQEKVPYGNEVVKIECTNHVIKNYGKRLYNLKNDTKNVSAIVRKQLTAKKILELQKISQKAIYDNAHGDVASLIEDLGNGPYHVFDQHTKCRDYYCNTVGDISKSQLQEVQSSGLFRLIQGALSLVIRKGGSLIDNETNNRAELYMSILARFNMGKRLNLTQRGSFQARSYLSSMRYNRGFMWHSSPWKRAMQKSPGKYLKKFMTTQSKYKRKLQFRTSSTATKKKKPQQILIENKPNLHYGEQALQPELNKTQMQQECTRILESLKVTKERRDEISKSTVGQFDNATYRMERAQRLTASNFGAVIKRKDSTSCHVLVKSILMPTNFTSDAIEYGKMNEAFAISLLEDTLGLQVTGSGLFIDIEYPYLGASPDGLIGDNAIVEVKCLYGVSKAGVSLETAAETISNLCLKLENGKLSLKRNHNYYFQVQGQLHITQRNLCYFVVFVNAGTPLFIEKICRDDDFWSTHMVHKLVRFYTECVLPEIVRGNLKRGLRCVDPDYILNAQKKRNIQD